MVFDKLSFKHFSFYYCIIWEFIFQYVVWLWKVKVKVAQLSNSLTPWTVAHQTPLSMEFSRQDYCSGLPFPFSKESSQPRDGTWVSCNADSLLSEPPGCTKSIGVILWWWIVFVFFFQFVNRNTFTHCLILNYPSTFI